MGHFSPTEDVDKSSRVRTDEVKEVITDDSSPGLTYVGRALIGTSISTAKWQISRTYVLNGETIKTFADEGKYTQVWNNRGSIFPPVTPDPIQVNTITIKGISTAAIEVIDLDDVTWVLAETSGGLPKRANLSIQNISNNTNTILWSYVNSGSDGWQVPDGASRAVALLENVAVYIKMLSGTGTAVVEELGTL